MLVAHKAATAISLARKLEQDLDRPVIPVFLLAGLTIFLRGSDLDLTLQARFYVPGVGWPHGDEQPWRFLYDYGVIPAWIISVGALGVLVASIWKTALASRRRVAVFFVLVMVIAPGLVVNSIFKQNWGRPRPKDVVELGGDRAFVPVWDKGVAGQGNSFASGHAAMAFYLLVPWFLARRTRRRTALVWLALGLAYGTLMGIARMAQGAHFFSDVLWACGFVYLVALGTLYALGLHRRSLPTIRGVC